MTATQFADAIVLEGTPVEIDEKPPVQVTGPVPLPEGWFISCAGLQLASQTESYYRNNGYYKGHEADDFTWWDALDGPAAEVDFERVLGDILEPIPSENEAPTCIKSADLDGDGLSDSIIPLLHPADMRPGFLLRWGDGRRSDTVGTDSHGHVAPAPGYGVCATSMMGLLSTTTSITDLSIVEAPGEPSRQAIEFSFTRKLYFEDDQWFVEESGADSGRDPLITASPWVDDPPAPACRQARRLRRARYRAEEAERVMWHPKGAVAKDACAVEVDLDADGVLETVSWVVRKDQAGLRVDWADGRTALLGAGNPVLFEVLGGEPGCNEAPSSFNDVWNVDVASWDGTAWELPDGRRHAPTFTERVDGPALALTNAQGHVDLVFLSKGEWRLCAVPFDWDRYFVFFPAMEQWNWVQKPPPAVRRYRRPRPVTRKWIKVHTPGAPPDDAGRFYSGN